MHCRLYVFRYQLVQHQEQTTTNTADQSRAQAVGAKLVMRKLGNIQLVWVSPHPWPNIIKSNNGMLHKGSVSRVLEKLVCLASQADRQVPNSSTPQVPLCKPSLIRSGFKAMTMFANKHRLWASEATGQKTTPNTLGDGAPTSRGSLAHARCLGCHTLNSKCACFTSRVFKCQLWILLEKETQRPGGRESEG